jgi:hypothetical protein
MDTGSFSISIDLIRNITNIPTAQEELPLSNTEATDASGMLADLAHIAEVPAVKPKLQITADYWAFFENPYEEIDASDGKTRKYINCKICV